jgi:hypothetical protein
MYRIEKYNASYYNQWNEFIMNSKNGTFLFNRDFMEYHNDRFTDFSLLFFEGSKLIAVLPANITGNEVHSHQGLTYGGLILKKSIGAEKVEALLNELLLYLKSNNIKLLKIKDIISIYHKEPSFELAYLLLKKGADIYRRDMNLAIDYSKPPALSKSKLKHFRKVSALGLEMKKDNNFETFWDNVLIPRLEEKHNVKPVHTREEIRLLHSHFPENIVQYNAYIDDKIVAGITLFNFGNVVKSQYGATTEAGEKYRALDFLFINLIREFEGNADFFDMGNVNEQEGKVYNKGLLKQKEELGCSVYPHEYYALTIH